MKKSILLYLSMLSATTFADNCFIAKENSNLLEKSGNCILRHSPAETFQIPLSLIAYDQGLMIAVISPELAFDSLDDDLTWSMRYDVTDAHSRLDNSYLWNFAVIHTILGNSKFYKKIAALNYGNGDLKLLANNSLKWLPDNLRISPSEQAEFLEKLAHQKLPVSLDAQNATTNLLYIGKFKDFELYGKKGHGFDSANHNTKFGWFVGFLKNNNKTITFVNYLEDADQEMAQNDAEKKLANLLAKSAN
jgi:beta-lactamase class D